MFTRTPLYFSYPYVCRGIAPVSGGTPFPWDRSVGYRATQGREGAPLQNMIFSLGKAGPILNSAGKPPAGTPFPHQGIVPVKRHRLARRGRAPTLGSPDGASCGVMPVWGPEEGGEYLAPPICEHQKDSWWRTGQSGQGGWEINQSGRPAYRYITSQCHQISMGRSTTSKDGWGHQFQ